MKILRPSKDEAVQDEVHDLPPEKELHRESVARADARDELLVALAFATMVMLDAASSGLRLSSEVIAKMRAAIIDAQQKMVNARTSR